MPDDDPQTPLRFDLRCGWCGRAYPSDQIARFCADCNRPLLARFHLTVGDGDRIRAQLNDERPGVWRYRRLLPVANSRNILTLGEGDAPLVAAPRLAQRLGLTHLWIKDESQNPTGSFKARGMTVAISRACELGVRQFCLPSAGNAAGAAAAYGALAGCHVRVYMPDDSGEAFFGECRAYGADVRAVKGTIADCGARMRAECNPAEWFDLSTLKEPFRLEGKKTMGYELWEDFDGDLPDVIIYPTGGGTGLIGMWKAFEEMEQLGWIDARRPRLISVQAEGCAPIVRAFTAGAKTADPVSDPHTAALGLRVPSAFGDFLILRALRESGGTAVAISEAEWAEGSNWMAADTGIFACPEGGATVAALRQLRDRGLVQAGDRVVLFNTGSGFKYPPTTWPRP
jgi:threonine synthase